MALTTTVGSATADSYVSVADADAYFAAHYLLAKATLWATLNTARKGSVLQAATKIIDTLRVLDVVDDEAVTWPDPFVDPLLRERSALITKYAETQALAFPRNVDVTTLGVLFIPQAVEDATCEEAVYLLSFDESPLSAQFSGTVSEEIWAGAVRVKSTYATRGSFVAPMALELMRPFLRSSTRIARA